MDEMTWLKPVNEVSAESEKPKAEAIPDMPWMKPISEAAPIAKAEPKKQDDMGKRLTTAYESKSDPELTKKLTTPYGSNEPAPPTLMSKAGEFGNRLVESSPFGQLAN